MKKYQTFLIIILAFLGILSACKSDFLDVKPQGTLSQDVLAQKAGVDYLLIGAYSLLDGQSSQFSWDAWDGAASNWLWGSVRGLEANKGSYSGDQPDMNPIQTFTEQSTNNKINSEWRMLYEGVSRCNNAIIVCNKALAAKGITSLEADSFIQQAKVLRGWYHFQAWRMWEKIPYISEFTDAKNVTNTPDVRDSIIRDLTEGTKLPLNMAQVGRFNRTVSQVILAKALMQMKQDWAGAKTLLVAVVGADVATLGNAAGMKPNGTPIKLAATYGEIFDIANRNGDEAIYTVQYSVNDGSGGANAGNGEVLNFPYNNQPGGCCGFFVPNQDLVNSFRTSAGLPLLDGTYDAGANQVKNDEGITSTGAFTPDAGPLDPRLDWTVGRRGINYWDWGKHPGSNWLRDQSYSGPYSPKKQVYKKSQASTYVESGGWTNGWTANGYRMIRYADVILLLAECEIQIGDPGNLASAFANINLIRQRASNPAGFVMDDDGITPNANYVIAQYPAAGAYPFDSQANALIALQMERKLELGMEGHRFFDLNRWGNTITELNRILTFQESLPWGKALYGTVQAGPNSNLYPIPQRQIDLSSGKIAPR